MTAPYLQGTGAVPEATALRLRGVQTDAYGEILGGHKALFDPMQQGLTGKPATNAVIPQLVAGGPNATVTAGFGNAANIEDAKGFSFTDATNEFGEAIDLGAPGTSPWNLRTLGAEASVVISLWLTVAALPTSAQGIAGYAYQNSQYAQWAVQLTSLGISATFNGISPVTSIPVTLNAPFLLVLHANRTGAGAFSGRSYMDGALIGSSGEVYPFVDPLLGAASARPRLGYLGGYGASWRGTIHRCGLLKVPQDFDIDSWMAAEIAANAGRW